MAVVVLVVVVMVTSIGVVLREGELGRTERRGGLLWWGASVWEWVGKLTYGYSKHDGY